MKKREPVDRRLICPFTVNAGQEKYLADTQERNILLFNSFVKKNKFHEFLLITDEKSYEYLGKPDNVEVELYDTDKFKFIDDFKVTLLPQLDKEEVIIDFDLYLYRPLTINSNYDLIVDRYEEEWAYRIYLEKINAIPFNDIKNYFLNIENTGIPNIGIFKIVNKKLLTDYYVKYFNLRDTFITLSEAINFNYKPYSALFSQFILMDVINNNKSTVFPCGNVNHYKHLNGDLKYKLSKNKLMKIINDKALV